MFYHKPSTVRVRNSKGSPPFGFPMVFYFVQNHWKSEQNGRNFVWISNSFVLKWTDHRYCYDRPFHNRIIRNLNFKRFGIPMCSVFKPPLYLTTRIPRALFKCSHKNQFYLWHKVKRWIILQNLFNFICWFSPNSQRYMFVLLYVRGGHTYCVAGRKTAPKNLVGTKMCPKKLGEHNLTF